MMKKMIGRKIILIVLAIFTVATAGIVIGRLTGTVVNAQADSYEELKIFTEALTVVRKNYVEDIKTKDLVYGSIKGMLGSLDPHSSFMTPEQYKSAMAEIDMA